MSRWYRISVEIENFRADRTTALKEAAAQEWPFEEWFEYEGKLSGSAEERLCGGESEAQFALRLAKAIWKANGGFCQVTVHAAYLEEIPYETYSFDEDDYEKDKTAGEVPN